MKHLDNNTNTLQVSKKRKLKRKIQENIQKAFWQKCLAENPGFKETNDSLVYKS